MRYKLILYGEVTYKSRSLESCTLFESVFTTKKHGKDKFPSISKVLILL